MNFDWDSWIGKQIKFTGKTLKLCLVLLLYFSISWTYFQNTKQWCGQFQLNISSQHQGKSIKEYFFFLSSWKQSDFDLFHEVMFNLRTEQIIFRSISRHWPFIRSSNLARHCLACKNCVHEMIFFNQSRWNILPRIWRFFQSILLINGNRNLSQKWWYI